MANTVTLMRRCKTPDGWRRLPAALGKNGRVRPGYVEVDGQQVLYEQGTYELRYYVDRKPQYEAAGEMASEALTKRNQLERKLRAREAAELAGVQIVTEQKRAQLSERMRAYVEDATARQVPEAAEIAMRVTGEFSRVCHKTFVDEITREDILVFHAALRRKGNGDRTISNKHGRLRSILIFSGVDQTVFPPSPRYEKTLPTIYEAIDLRSLIDSLEGAMAVAISTLLETGLREGELAHMEWPDISNQERTIRVRDKPEWNFKIKDSEQRDVPLSDKLYGKLRTWHEAHPRQGLLFPARNGKPQGHFLRKLKRAAHAAGLACGVCRGCRRSKGRECSNFTLHKFRRSYITTMLRSQVDLRTVQVFAGHTDLASTMRYLRPASGKEVRAKVNAVKWY